MGSGEEGGGLELLLLLATSLALAPALGVGAVPAVARLVAEGTGAVAIGEEVAAGREASLGWASTFPVELVLGDRARDESLLLSLAACLLLVLPPSPPLLLLSLLGLPLALGAALGGLRLALGGVPSLLALDCVPSLLGLGGRATASPSLLGGELLRLEVELLPWTGDLLLGSAPLKVDLLRPSTPPPLHLLLPSTLQEDLLLLAIA